MKAVILKGIPASGKTTYVMNNLKGYMHINKDKLREQHPTLSEKEISLKQKELIQSMVKFGTSIAIDNTHINPSSLAKVIAFCKEVGYEDVEVIDVFSKLVEELRLREAFLTCLERNASREKRVPESVLYSMAYQD